MSNKAAKMNYEPFEHTGGKCKDRFTRIYCDMKASPAWKDLTLRQRALYGEMKDEYDSYTVKGGIIVQESRINFHFPKSKWSELYGNSNTSWYKDKNALIEHGFIKQVECGKNSRTNNVYQYSDKWKLWTKEHGIPKDTKGKK